MCLKIGDYGELTCSWDLCNADTCHIIRVKLMFFDLLFNIVI